MHIVLDVGGIIMQYRHKDIHGVPCAASRSSRARNALSFFRGTAIAVPIDQRLRRSSCMIHSIS